MRPMRKIRLVHPIERGRPENDWWDVQRLDADGNQHGYYFCSNCHQEYVNRLRDADNSFESWKKNGGKQNG